MMKKKKKLGKLSTENFKMTILSYIEANILIEEEKANQEVKQPQSNLFYNKDLTNILYCED